MADEDSNECMPHKVILENTIKCKILIWLIPLILTVIGIILLLISGDKIINTEKEIEYTDCERFDIDTLPESCRQYMQRTNQSCLCKMVFNLRTELVGQITIYYELPAYDQNKEDYVNSRDDNQLKGVVNAEPSQNCEPLRYDNTSGVMKPIVPCGKIADTMFTDTFTLEYLKQSTKIDLLPYGIMSAADKAGFKNPDNLENAFRDFVKPHSWTKHIWELDTTNKSNNGFENEAFISWMRTDWKRKPLYRANQLISFQQLLPIGEYQLDVSYDYPIHQYNGQRKLIIVASRTENNGLYAPGLLLFLLGLVALTVLFVPVLIQYIQFILGQRKDNTRPEAAQRSPNSSNTREFPLLTNQASGVNGNRRL